MEQSRTRPIMLSLIGIGLLCAAFFPAMKINFISFLGTISMEISLRQAMNALVNTGRGWAVALAFVGVIIVVSNVLGYEGADKGSSLRWLTGGALLTLLFPINLLRAMDSVVAEVTEDSGGLAMVDTSLSLGLIIPSIAFIAVAGLAWYAASQDDDAPAPTTYVSTYNPAQAHARPAWMVDAKRR